MTKQEKEARNEQMRRYKAEGHTMAEVAEKFNLSEGTTTQICKGIAPQQRPCKTYRNQYTSGQFDRIANIKELISKKSGSLEYDSGFTNIDGKVNIKCTKCNSIFERSLITFRSNKCKVLCPYCKNKKQMELRTIRQIEKEKQRQERLKAKQKEKDEKDKFIIGEQITFQKCKICNTLYIPKTYKQIYCSDKCREQNHYNLKDGYRKLFPLEKVYKRDNGFCYICGGRCDWNDYYYKNGFKVYGNTYPSRDHVIPKSKGGLNIWSNIRLACRQCNSRKRDTPLGSKNACNY